MSGADYIRFAAVLGAQVRLCLCDWPWILIPYFGEFELQLYDVFKTLSKFGVAIYYAYNSFMCEVAY